MSPTPTVPVLVSLVLHAALFLGLWLVPGAPAEPTRSAGEDTGGADTGAMTLTLVTLAPEPRAAPPSALPTTPEAVPATGTFTAALLPAPLVSGPAPEGGPVTDKGVSVGTGTGGGLAGGPGIGGPLQGVASGKSVVYLLDRSMSMGPHGALERACRELTAELRRLPSGALFQVLPYNRTAEPLRVNGRDGLLPVNGDTVGQAERAVQALYASGGTDHVEAIRKGLLFRADVLYLLSDATDARELPAIEVRRLTVLNGKRTTLHTIELSRQHIGREDNPLRQLAEANGGTYRRVVLEE
jgi:hypothetical protein